jgi:hypothetical protein
LVVKIRDDTITSDASGNETWVKSESECTKCEKQAVTP